MLDENELLLSAAYENQNMMRYDSCIQYMEVLHKNLLFLGAGGDCQPNSSVSFSPAEAASGTTADFASNSSSRNASAQQAK